MAVREVADSSVGVSGAVKRPEWMVAPVRITRKLGLLVGVPLVAVVSFAALAVNTSGGQALRAENLRHLVATGGQAGELAHWLQAERAGAVNVLAGGAPDAADGYLERVATAQRATDEYRQARAALSALPAATAARLDRIDRQVARLGGLRDQVLAGRGAASAVAFTYRIVIADLLAFRESVAQAGGAPADLADRLRAAAALSQAAEQVGRQQVAVLRAVEFGPLTPAAVQEITAARTGHLEALSTFDGLAIPQWRAALERSAVGEEALAARRLEDRVARTAVGERIEVDPQQWIPALDSRMQRLREVEAGIDTDILAEVTALRDAQRLSTGGQIAAVLLAVVAAVGLAAILGRPVVRGLRRLRDAAHEVAVRGLPAAVARLEHQEALGGLTPEQVAEQAPAPVRVRGRDELAEVGEAFNAVHRAAVRTAAEQAQLRLSIAAIMLNLARRGQKLTGRLTAALDDVERDELDPNRLAQLYQLDLMATLLGGTNESLLVLGGAASAQVRTVDEPLADVLRGALGQVEQYTRIEPGVVDDGVAVRAGVVDEVVKLLAELLDNACRYSPPQAPVRVDAWWLTDRVMVQIADEGIGINPARRAELNRRLATRPPLDLAAVEAMGLTVVAYLAARHRIRVELREGHRRGTIAEVTLPPELVAVGIDHRAYQAPARVPRPRTPALSAPPAVPPAAPLFRRPDLPWPPAPAQTDPPVPVPGALDQTAELRLPIFEQVQRSQWFSSARDLAESASWQTPADEGWQAAARAASPLPAGTTHSGLPVRQPGAQLVPGGVDDPDGAAPPDPPDDWRDPVQVSAVAAAYSRGLSTGRAQHAAGPGTPAASWRSASEASGQAAGPGTLVRPQAPAPHRNGAPAS
ncbi:MAG: HAMP domain-containing protein [Micromonosporaceae bacterium]|nr:HAMP domain-containing protein [Micromonosporaceae bacterium]